MADVVAPRSEDSQLIMRVIFLILSVQFSWVYIARIYQPRDKSAKSATKAEARWNTKKCRFWWINVEMVSKERNSILDHQRGDHLSFCVADSIQLLSSDETQLMRSQIYWAWSAARLRLSAAASVDQAHLHIKPRIDIPTFPFTNVFLCFLLRLRLKHILIFTRATLC